MPKPELGTKRTCLTCGARFYDFGKTADIACPACGAAFDLEQVVRVRRTRNTPRAAVVPDEEEDVEEVEAEETEVEEVEEDEADDTEVAAKEPAVADDEEEEDDDPLIEDADELGDDDALGEVIDPSVGEDDDQR